MTYSKEFLDNLQDKFHRNIPLTVEEWNIICKRHLSERQDIYNEDGSIKLVKDLNIPTRMT